MASPATPTAIQGVFQIRGGKHFVFEAATNTAYCLDRMQRNFLVGDQVRLTRNATSNAHLELLHREERCAVGIVTKFISGRSVLQFPNAPHFIAEVCCLFPVVLHDRVVVHLSENGAIQPLHVFSGTDPRDDAAAVLAAYCSRTKSAPPMAPQPRYGPHRYTRDDCVDLCHLFTFTIDPRDSVDFDDAISVDLEKRVLYVHIVDIHTYLTSAAATVADIETRMLKNACTLYLANEHTEHLLPTHDALLETSLVVDQMRPVITVEVHFGDGSSSGSNNHIAYSIYRSNIVVKQRFTYEQVVAELDSREEFKFLHELATASGRKCIDIPSLQFSIGTNGLPTSCKAESSVDPAHALVANAMILANFIVGQHLHTCSDTDLPNRWHRPPFSLSAATPHERICDNATVNDFITLKKWGRAEYSVEEQGHFGLGLDTYVHFTSPMRRYADVLVHHILAGAVYDRVLLECLTEYLNMRGAHVRDFHALYRSMKLWRYLQTLPYYLSQVYVTGVSAAGVLWYCPDYCLSGFTHVSKLSPAGQWVLKEGGGALLHSRTGASVAVGKSLKINTLQCDAGTLQYTLSIGL